VSTSIISMQRGNITVFQFEGLPFYRLSVGVTLVSGYPAFSLVMRYPPGDDGSMVSLARVTVPFAKVDNVARTTELHRVANVALAGGSLDLDQARTREAMLLFKNNPSIKGDILERCIEDCAKIVQAYWHVRNWIKDGCPKLPDPDYVVIEDRDDQAGTVLRLIGQP
jgi:hypothetical protein